MGAWSRCLIAAAPENAQVSGLLLPSITHKVYNHSKHRRGRAKNLRIDPHYACMIRLLRSGVANG
jgi:hypothetical protein